MNIYRFKVKNGKNNSYLMRDGLYVETKSLETAEEYMEAWTPIFKKITLVKEQI